MWMSFPWKSAHQIIAILLLSSSFTVNGVKCPKNSGKAPVKVTAGEKVRIKVSGKGKLCILAQVIVDSETKTKTVVSAGRSYNASRWESVGGKYADLRFKCGKKACTVEMPELSSRSESYQLHTLPTSELSDQEEISRFLQQSTFGPTKNILDNWKIDQGLDYSFATWVKKQIETEDATFHRPFFRSRAVGRFPLEPENRRIRAIGRPQNPCDLHSRWRKYAFLTEDAQKELTIEGNGPFTLSVDGHVRLEMSEVIIDKSPRGPGTYRVCYVEPYLGGRVFVYEGGNNCKILEDGNSAFSFSRRPATTIQFGARSLESVTDNGAEARLVESSFKNDVCGNVHPSGPDSSIFGVTDNGVWYIFDQRVILEENTVDDPLSDGGGNTADFAGSFCANVARTFLNEDLCEWSSDLSTCGPTEFKDIEIPLDENGIRKLYEMTGRFVYAISNLPAVESPCEPGSARWRLLPEGTACTNLIAHEDSRKNLANKIRWSGDKNPFVRDIWVSENDVCESGTHEKGKRVEVEESGKTRCWEHSHKDYYNVYDFTYWTTLDPDSHPGNPVAERQGKPNPIKNFAWRKEAILRFPGPQLFHGIDRWENNKAKFGDVMGRLGDKGSFSDLPAVLRTEEIAKAFGSFGESPSGDGVLVCGSPGEVRNKRTEEPEFDVAIQGFNGERQFQKQTIFVLIALKAQDQLRQRTAHALSQLLVISPSAFDVDHETECWVTYYDIFVRNAFANYRAVLKEVSYSPMMAEMLSFLNSRSKQYILDTRYQRGVFPDENFAREIMQLFTIGTKLLNDDGTPVLDSSGNEVATYTNEDVKDGARAWTGFAQQEPRGNIEAQWGWSNRVDPMRILPERRDRFPKMLFEKYVGDGYPLCVDMPTKAFLKKGATYRLLGSFPTPQMQNQDSSWSGDLSDSIVRMELSQSSSLFKALCNKGRNGECNYRNQVILPQNLICHGEECDVDTLRVVKVGKNAYYEYIKSPCVQMPFYNDGKKTKRWNGWGLQCADPRLSAASEACCERVNSGAIRNCQYTGERMTFGKMEDRCSEKDRMACDFGWFEIYGCPCCKHYLNFWTSAACNIYAKVNGDGTVAIVHDTTKQSGEPADQGSMWANVKQNTDNWFRVHWTKGDYDSLLSTCAAKGCELMSDGSCMCPTVVTEQPVFTSKPKSASDILSKCHIGAFDINSFKEKTYTLHQTISKRSKRVKVWTVAGGEPYDKDTVFELIENGRTKFLKNMVSKVKLQTQAGAYEFRNAPHFLTLLDDIDLRDAIYETDAVLDLYFYHQNTAPFVSQRLIQRFGFSNPSPRYLKTVAASFRTGKYVWQKDGRSKTYGSGEYGDLSAVVAAILLDKEPRSSALDTAVSYGSLREPLLKVIHFLRAMEFEPDLDRFRLEDMRRKMGQMAHDIPTVFSNFLPDFSPTGQFSDSFLYAPEATVLNTPNTIGMLSGLFSLVKYGMVNCDSGFGRHDFYECWRIKEGDFSAATGQLTYRPNKWQANVVSSDLNLLLAAGRASKKSLAVIEKAYDDRLAEGGNGSNEGALRVAQQLFVATPEFNTNTIYRAEGKNRPPPEQKRRSPEPYKAVVYVFLDGGCDSYNMLAPKCEPLRTEYRNARGSIAMNDWNLITVNAKNTQTCNQFGVHEKLPFVAQSYNREEALFFANAGVLFEDVTKSDWHLKTRTQLFAHDVQQRDVQQADAFQQCAGTGVLGRMNDALTKQGFNTASISFADDATSLITKDKETPSINFVNPWSGVKRFDDNPSSDGVLQGIFDLNNATAANGAAFSELWGSKLTEALYQNEAFADALEGVDDPSGFPDSHIGRQLKNVAKLMSTRDTRKKNREAYYTEHGGYDTHDDIAERLPSLFEDLNGALKSFKEEMDKQGLWDQVTVVIMSEFARTLSPNSSDGTDHGWGGIFTLLGGDLKSNILGKYPENIADLDIDRGRLIPTTSVESCLNGVMQWMGVNDANLDTVLPNRNNFKKAPYKQSDLYR